MEDADQRQRQFIAEASHELRTPLAALLGRLELAAAASSNSPDDGAKALAQAHRLAELVDDLLILATLHDHIHPQMTSVDLEELVFAETQLMSIPIDISGVAAVRIKGDPKTFRRATSNLLANAARHASGCIAVTLARTDIAAVLTVDDDGSGVPDADRDRIFDRFTRVDPSHQRNNGRAGIGLALVSAVATEHGGSWTSQTAHSAAHDSPYDSTPDNHPRMNLKVREPRTLRTLYLVKSKTCRKRASTGAVTT